MCKLVDTISCDNSGFSITNSFSATILLVKSTALALSTSLNFAEHDVLVPMTSSLYVPGRLVGGSEVLVDIGAGFMVGKPPLEAKEILARKVAYLQNNTSTLAKVISQRQTNLQAVQQMMMERRNAIVAQQGTGGEVAAQ